ncbi:MAG: endonuclease/exonuclease/phosphatase family protein [Proteobacteria bacterium]|nr:endonuclease/exonuclease/phosphatase family protein [Pseudomonadota bacterium]
MTRRIVICIAILAGLISMPAAAQASATRFSAMTYNIRLELATDGVNNWPNRRAAVASLIRYYAPDLVGLQEVLPQQRAAIVEDLPDYTFVGAPRDDGKLKGEASPIGFRRARYTLLASGTFWLSPTPDIPGKGWDAAYPRVATWARLADRNGLRLLVVNTHLDNVGQTARLEGVRLIRRWIERHRARGEAVVLMGDFNSPVGDPAYSAVVADGAGALRDTLTITRTPHFGPAGTFNAFKIDEAAASPIDHIFVSGGVAVLRHATLTQQDGGRLPSDHYPVLADLCAGRRC